MPAYKAAAQEMNNPPREALFPAIFSQPFTPVLMLAFILAVVVGELQIQLPCLKKPAVLTQLWGAGTAQHCQQHVKLQILLLLAYPDPSSKCHRFH